MPDSQWRITVAIAAPLPVVWDVIEDVTLIPHYHPEVRSVDLISGTPRRAPGMAYSVWSLVAHGPAGVSSRFLSTCPSNALPSRFLRTLGVSVGSWPTFGQN
jgi:hypothetical protein